MTQEPEKLIHEGVLRPRKIDLPWDGLMISGQRIVIKPDANGNLDAFLQRTDGSEVNVTDVASMGGAPSNGTYLVTTAHADLSDEVVVGATPGGQLGGSWASPTVDDGADGTAIHDNVANEITAITAKATPAASDEFVVEDSAASFVKKAVTFGNLESTISHDNIADVSEDDHHAKTHAAAEHSAANIIPDANQAFTGNFTETGDMTITATASPGFTVQRSGSTGARFKQSTADTDAFHFATFKSRGNLGTPAAVESGDNLGWWEFYGYDDAGFEQSAEIRATATETWDASGFGTELSFWTVANNSTVLTERLTVEQDGTITIPGNIAVSGTVDGVDIAARDHAKYTDASAISAVEGEATLDLAGSLELAGNFSMGAAPVASRAMQVSDTISLSGPIAFAMLFTPTFDSSVTVFGFDYYAAPRTDAASFTLADAAGFFAAGAVVGAGSTITNLYGLYVANLTQGGSNYGVYITGASTYGLFVDSGLSRFDGDGTDVFELPTDATDPTGGGGAAAGRIPVKIGGVTKYIAYY